MPIRKDLLMNDHDAMLEIQQLMDGEVWTADTLDAIAAILQRAGYRVRGRED